MPSASSIIAKLNSKLSTAGVCDRTVYKRTVIRSGGDELTGVGVSVFNVDTLLTPQPIESRPDADTALTLYGTTLIPLTDYSLTVSPSALSKLDVTSKDTLIVFKESLSNSPLPQDEECFIVAYKPTVYQGIIVCWNLLVRSKAR